ncbi:MAG TPA: hypothetical protein VEF90_17845 [Xanthobacteraceae bacterium]|nr:hypothetical protein [Xanthobacteraceae bacterium]
MATPAAVVILAALTGASLPPAATGALFGGYAPTILAIDSTARNVYADLPKICAATDAPLDRLSDAADAKFVHGGVVRRIADSLARAADAACAAAKSPNTPADRIGVAVAAISAIAKANAVASPAPAPAPAKPVRVGR